MAAVAVHFQHGRRLLDLVLVLPRKGKVNKLRRSKLRSRREKMTGLLIDLGMRITTPEHLRGRRKEETTRKQSRASCQYVSVQSIRLLCSGGVP